MYSKALNLRQLLLTAILVLAAFAMPRPAQAHSAQFPGWDHGQQVVHYVKRVGHICFNQPEVSQNDLVYYQWTTLFDSQNPFLVGTYTFNPTNLLVRMVGQNIATKQQVVISFRLNHSGISSATFTRWYNAPDSGWEGGVDTNYRPTRFMGWDCANPTPTVP